MPGKQGSGGGGLKRSCPYLTGTVKCDVVSPQLQPFFNVKPMTKAIFRTHDPLHHKSVCVHLDLSIRQNPNGNDKALKQQPLTTPTPHLVPTSGAGKRKICPIQIDGSAQYIEYEDPILQYGLHLPETLSVPAACKNDSYSCHQPSAFQLTARSASAVSPQLKLQSHFLRLIGVCASRDWCLAIAFPALWGLLGAGRWKSNRNDTP